MSKPKSTKPMTKTESARMGKAASPWSRYPHCETRSAGLSHARYVGRGKRMAKESK